MQRSKAYRGVVSQIDRARLYADPIEPVLLEWHLEIKKRGQVARNRGQRISFGGLALLGPAEMRAEHDARAS